MVSQTLKPCILFILLASLAFSKEKKEYAACTKEDLQKTAGFKGGKADFSDKESFGKYRKSLGSVFGPCSRVGMKLTQLGDCGQAGDVLHELLNSGKKGKGGDFKSLAGKVSSALKAIGSKCGGAKSGGGKGGDKKSKGSDKKSKGGDKKSKGGDKKSKGGDKKKKSLIYFS